MELSWVDKVRIALVVGLGIVVIGVVAWPLAAPEDPLSPVRAWDLGFSRTMILIIAAFGVGAASYFVAWPHGREIGILAVPFGLAVWAARSGPMQTLTQAFAKPYERDALLQSLRFEPFYWLVPVAAGFAGVLVAELVRPGPGSPVTIASIKTYLKPNPLINIAIGLVVAVLVSNFFVKVFAQDLASYNRDATQPAVGQIVFAVTAAFAVAAFVVKKFFDLSYVWPSVASVFVILFAKAVYYNAETIQKFAEIEPATSFPYATFAILPVQLVALGAIGSVIGYWLAVKYSFRHPHEGV